MRRKCKICKEQARFTTCMAWGFCGNPECGVELNRMMNEKLKRDREKDYRRETKRRKDALLTTSEWIKKVQVVFNAYIRERDKELPCISCSRMDHEIEELGGRGGKWDAGHYRSRGASPELRFEPLNTHKQCKSCNAGSGKYARKNHTVQQSYRENLEKKIGIINLEWLEGSHPAKRYRVEELKELHKYWSDMLKQEKQKNEVNQ